jgi:putative ABC transport system substrate-binding protein
MRRRDVIQLLAGASIGAPYRVAAQAAKTYRLATFTATPAIEDSPLGKLLTEAMAQRGYTFGQNLEIKAYGADAQLARLPQLARDIVASTLSV